MKHPALKCMRVALYCASLSLTLTAPLALAESKSTAASRNKQEADARLAGDLAQETRVAAAAMAARANNDAEARERAARIAAALAAPIGVNLAGDANRSNRSAAAGANPAAGATTAAPAPVLAPMASEQRLALVIGNSSYKSSPLSNPVNDVRAMAIKLQQLGFTVIKKEDASHEEMMNAVRDFGNQLKHGGIGLFYYAGHGIQSRGNNFLVPVDANIRNEDELSTRAYNANEVLEKMDSAKNRINMVILDACRDNPFASTFRSGARGLAGIGQAPSGTLVAYATSPGKTASDGSGANGLYTEQLLRAMSEPGLKLEDVFKRVRVNVMERSEGQQLPWEMSSVTGDFYFNPTAEQASLRVAVAGSGTAQGAEQMRQLLPLLISRKLIDSYQLTGNFPLQGAPALAAFTMSGQYFTLAGKDKTLKVWNTMTGAAVAAETGYGDAALSADRRYLVGLADNGEVALSDLRAAVERKTLATLPEHVTLAALSPDGARLLVHSAAKGFALYDSKTGQLVGQLDEVAGEPQFRFAPAGHRLLTWGARDSNLKLWDTERGTRVNRLNDHWGPVTLARFSVDGALLLTSAFDDKTVVWRAIDGESVHRINLGDGNPLPRDAEFINQGKHVLAYAQRSAKQPGAPFQLGVWDSASGNQLGSLLPDGVALLKYRVAHEQGRLFVSASDHNVHVFDLATLKRVALLSNMEFVDLSADGRRFLVRNGDGVRLMDMQTMAPLARMPGQLQAFAGPKAGGLFATSAPDGALMLWNSENGDPLGQLKGHLDAVATVVFSADGRRMVSIGNDNTAKLWALPEIADLHLLAKDQFESTAEYHKRMGGWSSPYTSLVTLAGYNADAETFNVKLGELSVAVPLDRDSAKKLVGQRHAMITGKLKFFDAEQLVLSDSKLTRLP